MLGNKSPYPRAVRVVAPITVLLLLTFFILQLQIYRPIVSRGAEKQILLSDEQDIESEPESDSKPEDVLPFNPPSPSVLLNVIGGDSKVWTTEKKEWYSTGRHPNRPGCWTFADRFEVYKNLTTDMSNGISNNNNGNNTKAIILRLAQNQSWKWQFVLHVRALVLEAGLLGGYDVIIFVNLDMDDDENREAEWIKRIPSEFLPLVRTFSSQQLKDWVPEPAVFKNTMENNHIAVQMFMAQNSKYEFVYSIENDVRLIGRWDEFFADVDSEYAYHRQHQSKGQNMPFIPDLVTFESIRRPENEWIWLEEPCIKYFGGVDNTRAALGAVWGWSRRLTDTLTAENAKGLNCYYEYFAPTVAHKANLTTFFYQHPLYCQKTSSPSGRNTMKWGQLGVNDPKMTQYKQVPTGCTYFFVNPHSEPFWEGFQKDPKVCRPQALVHPVKGDAYN